METDKKSLTKWNNEIVTIKKIKIDISNFKRIFYIFIILIFLLNFAIFSMAFNRNKKSLNDLYNNINITYLIEKQKNEINSNDIDCIIVKNKLKNRTHPFVFENELLFFFDLISCKIPFSFIRFADGENCIMKGIKLENIKDKWYWNPKLKNLEIV